MEAAATRVVSQVLRTIIMVEGKAQGAKGVTGVAAYAGNHTQQPAQAAEMISLFFIMVFLFVFLHMDALVRYCLHRGPGRGPKRRYRGVC